MEIVLMVLAFGALMYFMMIRPQQRKLKEQQAMQAALGEGSRVMLTSGIFATVKHLGDQQAVLELAPGVDVTVVRGAIARALAADEEEFEYEDAATPGADVEVWSQPEAQATTLSTDDAAPDPYPYPPAPAGADEAPVEEGQLDAERSSDWQDPYAEGVADTRKDV